MNRTLIKVLIVDDELPLRQELRSMPWQSFGAELVGEAENGEEALLLCEELKPDLVITDIIMPIMDGMELLRCVKKRFALTQFILLTSHSDFRFAQEALKLGALEYVLKLSFEEDEIKLAVEKAREAIRRESDLQSYERERNRRDISQVLNAIAMGESVQDSEISKIWESWRSAAPFYPVRLHIEVKEGDRFHVLHEMKNQLEQLEEESFDTFYWSPIRDQDIALVFRHAHTAGEACQQAQLLMHKLHVGMEPHISDFDAAVRLMAVTGELVSQMKDVIPSLRSCSISGGMLFYDVSLTALQANQAVPASIGPEDHPEADLINRLWMQGAKDKSLIRQFYQGNLGPWAAANRFEPDKLKAFILRIREKVIAVHSLLKPSDYDTYSNQIKTAPTLEMLIHSLVREQESEGSGIRKIRSEVQHAKRIVAQRLSEAITLTSIAEEVSLSSYYLSRLFRDETGESFNDYVTRLRMERAMELLQTTQLKVYEVAERVGIPSYRYFSQLFRNWTGVAPNEYKRADNK